MLSETVPTEGLQMDPVLPLTIRTPGQDGA